MALNGIDVSNWQNGINLATVPSDFVFMKSTQGQSYLSPDFSRQYNQAKGAGKLLGVYHYIDGSGAVGEVTNFVKSIAGKVGEFIPVLDWEPGSNQAWRNEAYLEHVIKAFISSTGVVPMIYSSKGYFPYALAAKYGCPTWVAQYANYDQVNGYQANPWNETNCKCDVRQYTASGRLSGFNGNLDLNKAYLTADQWRAMCGKGSNSGSSGAVSGSVLELAVGVMRGAYGNGEARKKALGSRYSEVQSFINHIASASTETLAKEVIAGKYGNGETRKTVLGSKYAAVQKRVNQLL